MHSTFMCPTSLCQTNPNHSMKNIFFLFVFLFGCSTLSFTQNSNNSKIIYLKDGSFFIGELLNNEEDLVLNIKLTGGSMLNIEKSTILRIVDQKRGKKMLADGFKVRTEKWYVTANVHSLTARQANEFPELNRWSAGMHFSGGYFFNQYLGIGAGTGIDLHENVFIPAYVELNGFLSSNKTPHRGVFKRQIPITYSLQMGYNFPINDNDEGRIEELTGGWLAYPAVGLLFGTRRGPNIKVDIGYKFQKYKREFSTFWWNEYHYEDTVLLKSLAVRVGLVF